jgi:hypothetical protein
MDAELAPCAHCGGTAEYFSDYCGEGILAAVACHNCDMCALDVGRGGDPEVKTRLIASWNARVSTRAIREVAASLCLMEEGQDPYTQELADKLLSTLPKESPT